MSRPLFQALSVFAMLALGCDDTAVIPSATLELRVRGHSTKPDIVTTGAGSGELSVEQAHVSLTRLELVGCGDTGSIAAGALSADLLADPANEFLFDTAVVEYCALRVGVSAVEIGGSRADGLPVELASTSSADFELSTVPPATPFDASQLILGFDLGVWFDSVEIQGAAAGDEGVVHLDPANNATQLSGFEARTNLALGLYLDGDGDGELDADELVAIAMAN